MAVGAEAISTEHIQVRVVMAWTREEAVGVTTASVLVLCQALFSLHYMV